MRLTKAMLDAMMVALNEMLAGEGPMGCTDVENEKIMENADKAASWVGQELARRETKHRPDSREAP